MLAGAGADQFQVEQQLEQVDPSWFRTEERWQNLLRWRASPQAANVPMHLFGTVGGVALDMHGNLAAATSTGGMTGKRWGARRRFTHHWRWNICQKRSVRSFRNRLRRVFHKRKRGETSLRPSGLERREPCQRCSCYDNGCRSHWRGWRIDCDGPLRPTANICN